MPNSKTHRSELTVRRRFRTVDPELLAALVTHPGPRQQLADWTQVLQPEVEHGNAVAIDLLRRIAVSAPSFPRKVHERAAWRSASMLSAVVRKSGKKRDSSSSRLTRCASTDTFIAAMTSRARSRIGTDSERSPDSSS